MKRVITLVAILLCILALLYIINQSSDSNHVDYVRPSTGEIHFKK